MTQAGIGRCRLDALRKISAVTDHAAQLVRGRHIREGEAHSSSQRNGDPETLATLTLRSQMTRWQNVLIRLRAAKGVSESRRHIELRFTPQSARAPGFVRLEVLAGTLAAGVLRSEAEAVEFGLPMDDESASTRLLRAVLAGDDTFALRPEEPEEAWRIVEPVLERWREGDPPMQIYPVGASVADVVGRSAEPGGA
jgi:glucose-6-phosphate 1-dehydrogenase